MPPFPQGKTDHDATPREEWVLLARLVRPQGRNGELLAEILTDFPERFDERRELFLLPGADKPAHKVTLEDYWLHKGRIVLKFTGVDSISDAEVLRGWDVAIPLSQRAPLEEDTFYISDLVGCRVLEVSGPEARDVGEIIEVDREMTSSDLLVVKVPGSREEVLIPFVKAWLRKIDLEGKRIEMALPEGLLTINAPGNKDK